VTAAGTVRKGRIVRAFSNVFEVKSGDEVISCALRGRFRREGRPALAGDLVEFRMLDDGTGVIEDLAPRVTELVRPPIANVDQAVVVVTLEQPPLNRPLLDRLLVLAAHARLQPLVCVNKTDLYAPGAADELVSIYSRAGYSTVAVSALTGAGLAALRRLLAGRVSVFAGQSGVGKSKLLNALRPGLSLRVGEVSTGIGRGRHTTRRVELLDIGDSALVADTPGFSRLDLDFVTTGELASLFFEFERLAPNCRFSDCLHRHEPDCAVRAGLQRGEVAASRYENYLTFLEEIGERERRKYL
jgi:ribosome biogenesis GTPase